jgi:hypothetical protein
MPLPCRQRRPASMTLPLGAVDHHRHARDVGLAGDEVQEAHHGRLAVQHGLVHVDVDDLGAVLDLLARHGQRLLVLAGQDQPGEGLGAGDVGALADVDEQAAAADGHGLEAGQLHGRGCQGDGIGSSWSGNLGHGLTCGRSEQASVVVAIPSLTAGLAATAATLLGRGCILRAFASAGENPMSCPASADAPTECGRAIRRRTNVRVFI